MKLAAAVLFLILASVAGRSAMAGPVIWAFTETSCTATDLGAGCNGVTLPVTIGYLLLPDINFSGSYTFQYSFNCKVSPCSPVRSENYSGGFTLAIGQTYPFGFAPDEFSLPLSSNTANSCDSWAAYFIFCQVNFGFTSSAINGLTFSLDELIYLGANENINIRGSSSGGWQGRSSTDWGPVPGCTNIGLAACAISGTVALVTVPEPSSLSLLFSALLLGLFVAPIPSTMRRATGKRFMRQIPN
jgi:hypothetical protein